jgi:hypothetical protein
MQLRLFSLAACASFLLALVTLIPSRALADSITITQGLSAGVREGKGGSITYTVTNTGGANVTLTGLGFGPFKFQKGDPFDMPISGSLAGTCGIGTVLAPGATCSLIFKFATPNGRGEKDDNTGTYSVKVLVGTKGGFSATTVGKINVSDVPEPSTYLLFGTGLVSLAGVVRRKLRM